MKLWNLEIKVATSDGRPNQLLYKNRTRDVLRILDSWRSCEGWWWGDIPRDYWKLELTNHNVVEVYREDGDDAKQQRWVLSRSFD